MKSNFYFKKSLGQNFLKDKNVIHNIVDNAQIDKNSLIIEIGPGGGALTKEIVPLCKKALLYEVDFRLEDHLKSILSAFDNYSLFIKDFLKTNLLEDLGDISYSNMYVVANLPYYITTPIIMKFIDENVLPDKFVIMIQKEVASRLAADVGSKDYGSFTVLLNYYYDIYKLFDVSRYCFEPIPNVDSSVICMTLKKNRFFVKDISLFKRLVRDSFALKRKTIKNNLKSYDLSLIEKVLEKYHYDLNVRAEQLSLEVFVDMANILAF